jgi:hypothetical protein
MPADPKRPLPKPKVWSPPQKPGEPKTPELPPPEPTGPAETPKSRPD